MEVQTQLLNWAMSATVEERMEFLYKYLKVIPAVELDKVIGKVQGAKKRFRRNHVGNDKEKIQQLKKELKTTTDVGQKERILADIQKSEEKLRLYAESKSTKLSTQLPQPGTSSRGAQAVSSEAQTVPSEAWKHFPINAYVAGTCFEKFFPTSYVFIDCKTVLKNNGEIECGSVAVLDHNRRTIYKTKVFHPVGSYKVNSFTKSCNGFDYNSLCNPEYPKLGEVSEKVESLILNKLVILTGGSNEKKNSYNDLISLNLDASVITVYNLHFHFFKTTIEKIVTLPMGDEEQAFVIEPISLRRLCMKYFNVDIQEGIHDPETDAYYTAKIFQEILPFKLKPGLKHFVEYDMSNFCAYEERYVDFDWEPKMVALKSQIRAARKRQAP